MTSRLRLYRDLAKYYDAIYEWKNYPAEVRRLEQIARRYGRSGGTSWLDVACGTGKHLELLRRRHDCMGVDESPEMLRLASRRLPGLRLVRGDMRSFCLHRGFDVVSCLFSAVGHLTTEHDLRRAFENFSRHLRPGGVAIVEPWIAPSNFHAGHVDVRTYESPKATLVRCAYSRRHGNLSIIHYSYLVGVPGRGIGFFEETDRGLMVAPHRLQKLMRGAGLVPRVLSHGFTSDRGLLVGVKEAER